MPRHTFRPVRIETRIAFLIIALIKNKRDSQKAIPNSCKTIAPTDAILKNTRAGKRLILNKQQPLVYAENYLLVH